MKRVLCLPGGGLLGTITTTMLVNFQKHIGMSLQKFFNSYHGESTGSLEGSVLAAGGDIQMLQDLYIQNGYHIFTPQHSWLTPWNKFKYPLYDRQRVLGPLETSLKSLGVETYGQLKQKFVCGAVNELTKESNYFKSDDPTLKDERVIDIVERSFSALMYFGPTIDNKNKVVYGDNGTGINNNPTLPAFFENLSAIMAGEEFEFYCFGTGWTSVVDNFETVSKWNLINQLWDFYLANGETLARVQAQIQAITTMNWIAKNLSNVKFFYYNVEIPKKLNVMDGRDYIQEYVNYGNSVKF